MTDHPSISVVLSTYNRPDSLSLVLRRLALQSDLDFEVVVADDGSTEDTRAILDELGGELPFVMRHTWQPDDGFRAARARNRALADASGDYAVFLDGDCLPRPSFIAMHRQQAEVGRFIVGDRIMMGPDLTRRALEDDLRVERWSLARWVMACSARQASHLNPILNLRRVIDSGFQSREWIGVKTCNLGVWRNDLLTIDGFDESFVGWGREDADLAARLFSAGILRKDCAALQVIHLWHARLEASGDNERRLADTLESRRVLAGRGLSQHAASPGQALETP